MNIGSIKQNDAGIYMGRISTLAVAMTIALKAVTSNNPKAPRFEIHALGPNRSWVQVGAFFELHSNNTGEAFLNGRIDDPSLASPLQVSAFRQEDGSYNVVWSRPTRRRDVAQQLATKSDELPPFGGDDARRHQQRAHRRSRRIQRCVRKLTPPPVQAGSFPARLRDLGSVSSPGTDPFLLPDRHSANPRQDNVWPRLQPLSASRTRSTFQRTAPSRPPPSVLYAGYGLPTVGWSDPG